MINRDRRRIFVNNGWRTLVPLVALGTFLYEDDTYYADGYVSMPEPVCNGFAEDGTRLRWLAVPTEDGGREYQCVAYSTQRHRTITEITVPAEPVAEAPPAAEPETVGVGPANEPAVASPEPPAAPATGCELLMYSETNFKGLSAPVDEDQPASQRERLAKRDRLGPNQVGNLGLLFRRGLCRRNDAAERRFLPHARPEVD